MEASQLQALQKSETLKLRTVYRRSMQSNASAVKIQDLLEASRAVDGVGSLARGGYIERFWAHQGDLQLEHIAIGDLRSGKPIQNQVKVILFQVEAYDPITRQVVLNETNTSVSPADLFEKSKFDALPANDRGTIQALNVLEQIQIYIRQAFGGLLSFQNSRGEAMIGLITPHPDHLDRTSSAATQCRDLIKRVSGK